ncbi:uncharacterized protein LOC112051306 [Bicyclus anynana]|uniref:Uncharacterized protein LOC112051306 n=1 Tax=Bicyclus anynana TaxID=110368 RepID=A0A6J1ND09_BICAN|nr:uncharacterized protein LOC112051306 [Bicyclus anynana]
MLSLVFITLVLSKTALCQLNGEFWWLHEKVAAMHNIEPPQPKFEEISELETDESVKVLFKDNVLNSSERTGRESNDKFTVQNKILPFIVFVDRTKLSKEDVFKTNISLNNNINEAIKQNNVEPLATPVIREESSKKGKDEFKFIFPVDNEDSWEDKIKNFTTDLKYSNSTIEVNKKQRSPKIVLNDKIWFEEEKKDIETESICTFVSPHECLVRKGFINAPSSCPKNIPSNTCKICCVIPLSSSKPQNSNVFYKRYRRSDPDKQLNAALKQRNALLQRKYNSNTESAKFVTTTVRASPVQKIVRPNDYVDPFWNIKNLKSRNPNLEFNNNANKKDYDEDYAAELPKPGLAGLYSDIEDRVTSWKLKTNKGFSFDGIDEESDEEDKGFGYSTIDPRFGTRKTTPSKRRHPQRPITPSAIEDSMGTSESQTIHFHSTPDFRVLEGFKLINLAENKDKHTRKPTTEKSYTNDEQSIENTSPFITNVDFDYDDEFDVNQQVFKNCGKTRVTKSSVSGKGPSEGRSDPWLVVVVLTKSPDNILCYATILHPRAALTAASCVHGKATGDILAVAGVWKLKERTQSQHRMASIHIHPQFSADDLANDLAILHWKRPLRLHTNVYSACLADPHVGDECYFVGWGGYDQALKERPQWQRATIQRTCDDKVSSPEVNLPTNAFCASVETRGTVTGVGGPLLCRTGDRVSAVGVAVYRENVVVLLPAFEWATSALRELQIN